MTKSMFGLSSETNIISKRTFIKTFISFLLRLTFVGQFEFYIGILAQRIRSVFTFETLIMGSKCVSKQRLIFYKMIK